MKRTALCLLLALPACDDGSTTSPELLHELRQLRGSVELLAQRPASQGADLDKSLAPLREVLQTLAQDQQDLRTRQLALTGELQRWTQLLSQGLAGAQKPDTTELQARLQQLEQELQQQNARHQEVQELLRQALEKTSDRLEGFLQKLETVQPGKTGAPVDASAPKAPVGDPGGEKGQTAAGDASPWLQPSYQPRNRARAEPWTIALLSAAVLMVAAFAWRYWRAGEARGRHGQVAPVEEGPGNTDELWAAAALLSEAVGRLKAAVPASAPVATGSAVPAEADLADWLRQLAGPAAPEIAVPAADDLDDGVFVLDDEVGAPDEPAAVEPEVVLPAVPPVAVVRSEPEVEARPAGPSWREIRLTCRRPELVAGVVEAALAGDPRVLRRPAPEVRRDGDRVHVRFCLLPDLAEAEAVQFRLLLQRLAGS